MTVADGCCEGLKFHFDGEAPVDLDQISPLGHAIVTYSARSGLVGLVMSPCSSLRPRAGEISGEAAERLHNVAALSKERIPTIERAKASQLLAAEPIGRRTMSVVPIDAAEGPMSSMIA
jgi:hypothetical protein